MPSQTRALAVLMEYRQRKLWGEELVAHHGLLAGGPQVHCEGQVPSATDLTYQSRGGWCALPDEEMGEQLLIREEGFAVPCMTWSDFKSFVGARKKKPGCSPASLSFCEIVPFLDYDPCEDYPQSTPMEAWEREKPDAAWSACRARTLTSRRPTGRSSRKGPRGRPLHLDTSSVGPGGGREPEGSSICIGLRPS